jgi:sterol desaturase/sphingolipid hydroxylase (fatty acid hydroxylase superfamily)
MYVLQFWHDLVTWLSAHLVTPALLLFHRQGAYGDPREIAEALAIAAVQLCVIGLILRPLESLAPAERWIDRRLTRVDRQYTLLMLLGILPLFTYLVMAPFAHWFGGASGGDAESVSGLRLWVPWFNDHPVLLFFAYYAVYDLVYYWMHRMQHAIPWWWALHSMHHSQRQVNCWTNDRGSYLDAVLQAVVLASVGLAMGVEPGQFALLMLAGELVQNLSHTNVRVGFGRVLERVFVDPRFHRLHHMRSDPGRPGLHNCNFGQVFSVWDILFGTALYGMAPRPTGVGDPVVDADNECGLLAQQWAALKRFWGAFRRPAGWKPGEVSFGHNYEPISSSHAHPG